jgi:ribonuclease P protein 1
MFLSNFVKSVYRFQQASRQISPFALNPNISHRFPCREFCAQEKSSNAEQAEAVCEPKRRYVTLTEEVISSLTKGDTELIKRLKMAEFEYEISKQEGTRAPPGLTIYDWQELLELESTSKRKKFLAFLFKREMTKLSQKNSKIEQQQIREAKWQAEKEAIKLNPPTEEHIKYGLGHNTIFLKVYDTKMDHYENNRMIRAERFELPVVFDHSYEQHMTQQELKNAAKQLALSFITNREHENPFPFQYCNVNFNGPVMKHFLKWMPHLYSPEFPINLSSKSYLDLFPREKLVYLTPHCKTEMTHFDFDSVYIIGTMVDKSDSKPHSLAFAKRDNIRMAKLPLDRYLRFGGGSGKCLALNHMISILLEVKTHGDWKRALEVVPKRKLLDPYSNESHLRTVFLLKNICQRQK